MGEARAPPGKRGEKRGARGLQPGGAMRSFFLCFLAVAACSGHVQGSGEPDDGSLAHPSVQPLQCVARDSAICGDLQRKYDDEPPRTGALVWAQLSIGATAPDRAATTPQVALYEDGTLRRSPVIRNLTFSVTPPRGLLLAKVAASSLAKVRADVDALAEADFRAFFSPDEQPARESSEAYDILDVGTSSACLHALADSRSSCKSAAIGQLQADLGALAAAAELRWREAQVGTVSLGAPMTVDGEWPLADERAVEGGSTFTQTDWQTIGTTGLFRLHSGDYVEVNLATSDGKGGMYVYLTRMAAVPLGDDVAPLRDELLANAGRYVTSKGEWLGVQLAADRFPAFKNHEVAVVSSKTTGPAQVFYLYVIEQLDLRREGEIALLASP
ncbi:MAG: hypothetical protein JWP87_2776 [Labilithrix sp.]|nr:hypothetical protein [Labilithrix sp.]